MRKWGERNHRALLVGVRTGAATVETARRLFKNLEIEPPYYLIIILLDIYPRNTETVIQRDACTPVFTVALSTIGKLWKQMNG